MNINEAIDLIQTTEFSTFSEVSRWADLGCGDGLFSRALGHLLPAGSSIYAIDKKAPFEIASTGTGVDIITKRMDFVYDEPRLENMDGILMANALHYVDDQFSFVKKMKTWLKPGAMVLVVEYDTDTPVAKWVPYPLSYPKLEKLFTSAGYGGVKKLRERPSVYGRANMYSALIKFERG